MFYIAIAVGAILLLIPVLKFVLQLIVGVIQQISISAGKSARRAAEEEYEQEQSIVTPDTDWSESDYLDCIRFYELVNKYSYDDKDIILSICRCEDYEHFYDYLTVRLADTSFKDDIVKEFEASLRWMCWNNKNYQPESYLMHTFCRRGVLNDIETIKEIYGGDSVPKDFRVISPDYRNAKAVELHSRMNDHCKYSQRRIAEMKEDDAQGSCLVYTVGTIIIILCIVFGILCFS